MVTFLHSALKLKYLQLGILMCGCICEVSENFFKGMLRGLVDRPISLPHNDWVMQIGRPLSERRGATGGAPLISILYVVCSVVKQGVLYIDPT